MLRLQVRPSFRWFNADFDLAPLAVVVHVGRTVADAVLMPEFDRDAGRNLLQFRARFGEEGFTARGLGYLLKDRLPLHVQRTASRATHFNDPDAVNLHAGLSETLPQLAVCVAR